MENVHPFQSNASIRAEARAWVLKFNADIPPTDEDVKALREWSKRSSVHRAELERAEKFWCDADLLSELAVPTGRSVSKNKPGFVIELFRPFLSFGRQGAVTAIMFLGLAVTISFWLLLASGTVGNGVYETGVGEQRVLTLLDESQMQLDTNSLVRVNYSEGMRQIKLLRGKAHFDVAKNPDRPFEVYAGDGFVRAVGTAFSVYLDGHDVQVTVNEGRVNLARRKRPDPEVLDVSINRSGNPGTRISSISNQVEEEITYDIFMSVGAGQKALFNGEEEQLSELEKKDLRRELAWKRGMLIFVGEPLHKVVMEVSRYTEARIEISDPELSNLQIGGRFRVGELDALFDVLEAGFGVQISYINKEHIQLRASSN